MAVFPGKPPNPLGLKVELNLAGVWTDITSFVMQRDQLQITNMGRVDESGTITPSQLTMTLKNKDGRFTPKNSSGAYYPNIVRNTPIRVSVNATSQPPSSVAYSGYRYSGEVSSWPPTSDISQHDLYVQIVASGIWRRISQSQATIGSAYSRYVTQLTGVNVPATSWTMEDGSNSLAFTVQIGAGSAATWTGTPSLSSDGTSFPGSDALPQFNNAKITAVVSSAATPTDNVTRYALSVPAKGDPNAGTSDWCISETDSSGTVAKLQVFLNHQGTLTMNGLDSGGSQLFTTTTTTNVQAVPILVSAELTPSGGNVTWTLNIIKPGGASILESKTGTITTATIAAVSKVVLNRAGVLSSTTFGQLGIFYASPSLVTAAAALNGFAGEFAVVRFQRLCAEFSINTEVIGSTSAAMGPQVDDTLANLLQVIENTDGGLLYETTDQLGLGYRTLISLQNQAVTVTLNFAAGVLGAPLAATYDDQLLKNQWTVTNWDGYTALATLTSGSLSIQPVPNGAGLYAGGPLNVSANTHAQVNAIAQQRLFQGTVDDVRYPQVTVDARRGPAAGLFSSVPSLRIGDYIQVTNLPAYAGGGTAKQLVWGWTETLNAFNWTLVFNTVPELPFETTFSPGVFSVVQAPTGATSLGGQVGSSVSGSQIGAGAVGNNQVTTTLSARSVGGMTAFVSAATPYDWSFAVSGTPADATYFICTANQALPIAIGDTFTNSGGLGGPFTVATLDPPSGGNINVHFTPTATSVMSTGTVFGGKNGDTWVNTSAGNQVNVWANGAWIPITWNAASVITANSITAGLIAAGTIIAGIVNGTVITGATIIADGTSGELLVYSGTPAVGNLIGSWSGAAGTDTPGNAFPQGLAVEIGGLVLFNQGSAPSAVSGASSFYSSSAGRPRYLSQVGNDSILDRSAVNVAGFTVGNTTTPGTISAPTTYMAGEGNQSSEFEIEIVGHLQWSSAGPVSPVFQLYLDGSPIGGGTATQFTVGITGIAVSDISGYRMSFGIAILTTGVSGTVGAWASGIMWNQSHNRIGANGANVGAETASLTFDTTISHTLQVFSWWASTSAGQTMTTDHTRIIRRD